MRHIIFAATIVLSLSGVASARSIMNGTETNGRSIMNGTETNGRSIMNGTESNGRSIMNGTTSNGRSIMNGRRLNQKTAAEMKKGKKAIVATAGAPASMTKVVVKL